MPNVNKQIEADKPRIESSLSSLSCDTEFLHWLERYAENAAVAECFSRRSDEFRGEDLQVLSARLKAKMKGVRHWSAGEIADLKVFGESTGIPRDSLAPSRSCILYFKDMQYHSAFPRFWLYPCGVLPATKENMAMTQRNLKLDKVDSE
jgi:hypothetical protein